MTSFVHPKENPVDIPSKPSVREKGKATKGLPVKGKRKKEEEHVSETEISEEYQDSDEEIQIRAREKS